MKNNKKTTKDIENLLNKQAYVASALSEKEKAVLKQNIDARRNFGKISESPSGLMYRSPYAIYLKPFASVLLVVFLFLPVLGAHMSLPGDMLYGVKTDFNEKIPLVFYTSDTGRAEYYSNLSLVRLNESAKLLKKNSLSEDAYLELEEALEENVSHALSNIDTTMESKDADRGVGAASRLSLTLAAHRILFERYGVDKPSLEILREKVKGDYEETKNQFLRDSTPNELEDASGEIIDGFEESLKERDPSKIELIQDTLEEVYEDIQNKDYDEAFRALKESDDQIILEDILETLE